MKLPENVTLNDRSIGGKRGTEAKFAPGTEVSFTVKVPAAITADTPMTEGMANVLNQVLAENVSNNLRAKILAGVTEGEGDSATTRELTQDEVQAIVDGYIAEYEFGVRRSGSGEPRVTDPVEKEARAIAQQTAREFVKSKGQKWADVDGAKITQAVFDGNREKLMAAAKKIVDQRNKAGANEFSLEGVELAPKAEAAAA